jgi:hypothetical protein
MPWAALASRRIDPLVNPESTRRRVQARLGDAAPPIGVAWRLAVEDPDLDRHGHAAPGLDHERRRPGLDAGSRILVGVILRGRGIPATVPEVELVEVGERLDRPVRRPRDGRRRPGLGGTTEGGVRPPRPTSRPTRPGSG